MTTLLDAWREPDRDVCLIVEGWLATRPLSGMYVTRSADVRMIWNYLRHVGLTVVARKVRSRLWERIRNRKWAGIGVGTIIECPARHGLRVGTSVVFFAPNHSIVWPRLCLNQALVYERAASARTPTGDAQTALTEL